MKRIYFIIFILPILLLTSCEKDFLDVKGNKSQAVPATIADYQAILDDASGTMNAGSGHELGIIGADEITLSYPIWEQMTNLPAQKNGYIWAKEVYEGTEVNDWNRAYRRILFANTALEGIEAIKPLISDQQAWNNVKGSALFFRAFNFYQLAQLFCPSYNTQTSTNASGIPLRLKADITLNTQRSTVKETYEQIIKDLAASIEYLPALPSVIYRPSKAAVYSLLTKVYMQMHDYSKAAHFANLSLEIKNNLIDFNTTGSTAQYTFPANGVNNPEIIFMCNLSNIGITATARINISPELLNLYPADDLRKNLYYRTVADGRVVFKGSYIGSVTLFTGLAVDETLINSAESNARLGNIDKALTDINTLRAKRINKNLYTPISIANPKEILSIILSERKKELVLRGTRWEDLRRLNQETEYAVTLKRYLNGITYEIIPNDIRYIWPIPNKAIDLGGYTQNPR